MHPFLAGLAYELNRRLTRHQGRPPRDARQVPMWRLLVDEVVYLARGAPRPAAVRVWLPTMLTAIAVLVALAERTPGPVLSLGWRLLVAVIAAMLVAAALGRWFTHREG